MGVSNFSLFYIHNNTQAQGGTMANIYDVAFYDSPERTLKSENERKNSKTQARSTTTQAIDNSYAKTRQRRAGL